MAGPTTDEKQRLGSRAPAHVEGLTIGLVAFVAVLVGAIPRIALAAGALPEMLRPLVWSDALFTYLRGLTGHRLPYVDTPFEYPPLIGAVSGLLSTLTADPAAYVVGWSLTLALCAAVCAVLLARAAGWRRTLLVWAAAPQLVLLGSLNFDIIPATLLTAAALGQRGGRDLLSAGALAAGTAAKLFPLASLPIALRRSRDRRGFVIVTASVLALFYLPTALQPHSSAGGVVYYLAGIRANIDSVWGLLERVLTGLGVPAPSVAIVVLTLSGLAATYVVLVLPRAARATDPAVGFCLATVALLFWTRLYSPQYSLWLLPFFALLDIDLRRFLLLTVADLGVFFTIYPLTLVPWGADDGMVDALLGALVCFVVLRHVALLWLWRAVARLPAR